MKLLRILTGHHAGAQVVLTPGAHRIGRDDDADIQLTDWRGPDVLLTMDDSGAVCSERMEDSTQGTALDPCKTWMIDFVPMQFDDTVVCIGWADAAWPSDLALLSTLLNGPSETGAEEGEAAEGATRSKKRRYAGIAVACAAVIVAAAGISFALTTNVSRAAIAPPDVQMEQKLNRALAEAHLNELHIAPDGTASSDGTPRVTATGMVRTASDDYVARQLFERMKPGIVERRYGVADDTARGIRDAIGIDGVEVKYDGQGVFTLSGTVANKQRVERALARVKGDFGKRIREVRIALTDAAQPASAPKKGTYIALVSSGDVQYAQTPDGVKHIYTVPASDAEPEAEPEAEPDLPH
jgi:type III secretion protein D